MIPAHHSRSTGSIVFPVMSIPGIPICSDDIRHFKRQVCQGARIRIPAPGTFSHSITNWRTRQRPPHLATPPQPESPRCPAKVWSRRRNRIFAILSRGWPGCATTRAEPARPSAATAACKDAGQRSLVCRAHRKRRACVPRHASWRSMISPQAPSSAHQMLGPCRASTPEW